MKLSHYSIVGTNEKQSISEGVDPPGSPYILMNREGKENEISQADGTWLDNTVEIEEQALSDKAQIYLDATDKFATRKGEKGKALPTGMEAARDRARTLVTKPAPLPEEP